jgi:putative heme iron utilization protein
MTLAVEARRFLRGTHNGLLSTFSARHEGYPYGSVAPFVLDHDGQPLILISTIAEHTKNIIENCKVSLLVFAETKDGPTDLLANGRLTLLGDAEQTDKSDPLLRERYLRYFPAAAQYFEMHDFYFYRIQLQQARYIAGFGKMAWMEGSELRSPRTPLAAMEAGILEHMNADHHDSLLQYCAHVHGVKASNAKMVGIDSDGFDVRADTALLRFDFEQPIHDAQGARAALVALSKQCRA